MLELEGILDAEVVVEDEVTLEATEVVDNVELISDALEPVEIRDEVELAGAMLNVVEGADVVELGRLALEVVEMFGAPLLVGEIDDVKELIKDDEDVLEVIPALVDMVDFDVKAKAAVVDAVVYKMAVEGAGDILTFTLPEDVVLIVIEGPAELVIGISALLEPEPLVEVGALVGGTDVRIEVEVVVMVSGVVSEDEIRGDMLIKVEGEDLEIVGELETV